MNVFFTISFLDPAPVSKSRNKFLLLIFVLIVFLERLHSSSILNVEAVDSATLITNEELTAPVIHSHASNVFRCAVTENTLKSTINSIPDFNAASMSSNKSVEHWVVKDTAAGLVVSKMMISRLIVVVELHTSTSSNNTFRRLGDGEAVNFIQWAVKGLYRSKSTDIPDSEHTRDIGRNNLVGSLHPFDSN